MVSQLLKKVISIETEPNDSANTYSHWHHPGARRTALALGGKAPFEKLAGRHHHRQGGLQTAFPDHHNDHHHCGDLRDSPAVQEVAWWGL